ncbi:MAG: hypothetical protein Q9209_005687 [Squamulea sp. 1 TL-2023]
MASKTSSTGKDIHVIDSPNLVVAVQKNPRVYDFSVFLTLILRRLFHLDKNTMKLASANNQQAGGSCNLMLETSRIFHRYLSPGSSLEKMERAAFARIKAYIDKLTSEPDGAVFDLLAWLRTVMSQ